MSQRITTLSLLPSHESCCCRENSHHFIHHCKMVMNTIIHIIKIYSDDEKLIRNMDVMVSTEQQGYGKLYLRISYFV